MTRPLVLFAAAAAAILSVPGPPGAQPGYPNQHDPVVVAPPINPYPADSGAAAGSDINCEPPGLPPGGIGALPPSNHICQ